jgi:hypothetical protein
MHHDGKKGYFVALREAWFQCQWDLIKLSDVKATLRKERGMNDAAIEAMLYYDVDYFCVRVPCIVLPPSILYRRVQAIYEMYGPMRIGHYDTWLIDYLQTIVERNHGVLLYPDWSNASDYTMTREKFGTVAIHSPQLAEAINNIELNKDTSEY